MRTNLPVVSTTDLKGTILSASPDFVRISGYTEAELIGQPQNLVRHPDMPSEAFASLWSTIKTGRTWMGLGAAQEVRPLEELHAVLRRTRAA